MAVEKYVCPKCGANCEADFVDIGVGEQRVSPWGCPECNWREPTQEDLGLIEDAGPFNWDSL